MSATAKLGIELLETPPAESRLRMARWYHGIAAASPAARRILTLLMMGAVAGADFISGTEISFSILYLLPIVYAAWFIDVRTGLLAAVICATIWFAVEVHASPASSHPWIPLWNAGLGLAFFLVGVGVVALIRRREEQLRQEVWLRTRSCQEESERRRRLEREILEMSAHEQARLAQDLHDGLGQYLSALAFHARILSDDLQQHGSPLASHAERLVTIIRRTNQITRQLDRALRLPEASKGGLIVALRALAVEFEQLTDVHCDFQTTEPEVKLNEFRTLMLFRIAQEAFSNAVKHANPRLVRLSLGQVNHTLTLRIFDDAQGLAKQPETEPGSGLRIMRLRAELIGARLEAGPTEGGYKVECVLPLSAMESERIVESKSP